MNNYHTHTTFCDGADSPESLVQEAMRLGCTEIGFSGHSHLPEDDSSMTEQGTLDYVHEIHRLQKTLLIDTSDEETSLIQGLRPLRRGPDTNRREWMTDRGKETALFRQRT